MVQGAGLLSQAQQARPRSGAWVQIPPPASTDPFRFLSDGIQPVPHVDCGARRLRSRLSSARQLQPPPSTSIIITSTSQATTTTKTPIVQPQPKPQALLEHFPVATAVATTTIRLRWIGVFSVPVARIAGTTVQRGDVAYGQPGNYGDAVNTLTAGSDGGTTTVTKTYDNGDVKLRNMRAPAPQATPPQALVNSSGGGTNTISGVAGNRANNMCLFKPNVFFPLFSRVFI